MFQYEISFGTNKSTAPEAVRYVFNVYDRRIDRANSELSKLIIGQTMTIEDGSSLSQSETHLEVFQNLIEADCDIAKGNLTLAYIPDNEMCAACKLVRQCFEGKTRKSELKRIEENKKLYDKLSKDKRYKEVEFNPETGALKATHLGHNDGEDIGFAFEKKLVDALYKCLHSVILCDEQKKGKQASSRKFRRKAHVLLHQGKAHLLPLKSFEVMSPWDLGGDGKAFF